MRHVSLALALLAASALALSCAGVRMTGPKTSVDYCVDRCEMATAGCDHPMYEPACRLQYDSCVASCDPKSTQRGPSARL